MCLTFLCARNRVPKLFVNKGYLFILLVSFSICELNRLFFSKCQLFTFQHQFSLSDIVCIQCSSEPGSPRLTIHTPRDTPSFIQVQFSSDSTMEEWQSHLATVCSQLHQVTGNISSFAYNYFLHKLLS